LWHSEDSAGYAIEKPCFGIKWNFTFFCTFWVQCQQRCIVLVTNDIHSGGLSFQYRLGDGQPEGFI
jgi:hypothetical protein